MIGTRLGHAGLVASSEIPPAIVAAQHGLFDAWRKEVSEGGAGRVGWKLGHAIPEVQAVTGERPVVGYLTTTTLLDDGDTYRAGRPSALRAETEPVLELGREVGAAADDRDIRRAIAAMAVGLELVDVGRPPGDVAEIVAANVFHRAVVLGRGRAIPGPGLGSATLTINGRIHHANEQSRDPVVVVREVARMLEACGERLMPGDRILAGSVVHVPVRPGDHVVAHMDELGRVSAHIAT